MLQRVKFHPFHVYIRHHVVMNFPEQFEGMWEILVKELGAMT